MANKMTLLSMVKDILNSINGDIVNSISDTLEAQQVAQTIRTTYFNLLSRKDWKHTEVVRQFTAASDVNQPTKAFLPDSVYRIHSVKYNCKLSTDTADKYKEIIYLEPQEFLDRLLQRSTDAPNVDKITTESGTPLYIITDIAPTYYTSFDDEAIYFDSYDSAVDTTIQASKSLIYCIDEPSWTDSDSFIPDMPAHLFPMFLETARRVCAKRHNDKVDDEAEKESMKQFNTMRYSQYRTGGGIKYYNYGMRRRR